MLGVSLRVINCLLPLRPTASLLTRAPAIHCTAGDAGGAANDAWVSDASFAPSSSGGDTVFALSSGAGRAGVSVVRVSGPHARDVFERMVPGRTGLAPEPRKAVLRKMWSPERDDDHRELIDEVLALWFPAPNSFTGEDTVELHTHGSRAVVSATLEALGRIDGLRLAEPGEFTRQAFANGRMELTQVEGLADLINADTEEQRKQALRNMGGAQRTLLEGWRTDLLGALAHTEALIDFGEDADDVTTEALAGAVRTVRGLRRAMEAQLADGGRGEVVRVGVRVAILGPPNAGKSTLLNALAQRPAAIVSPRAGTTRDVVQVTLQLGGLPVLLSDTAGLREHTDDPIEQQGMQRAAVEAANAHVQLWVHDAATPPTRRTELHAQAHDGGEACADAIAAFPTDAADEAPLDATTAPVRLLVLNKLDLIHDAVAEAWSPLLERERQWRLSCETGEGLQPFLDALAERVAASYGSSTNEAALITRARHREHLRLCADALAAFEEFAELGDAAPLDLAAEEIRIAANELGRITGRVDVEELLDVIFRDFCIGK